MTLSSASLSISHVQGISNTINANPTSISSLSGNASTYTTGLVSNTNSTVGDPIAGVLNKSLSRIASVNVLTEKKINDLTTLLDSYSNKNSSIQLINNTIVITTTSQNEQQGRLEKQKITSQINSIKNTISTLQSSLSALQSINSTISIISKLLSIQEALLTINPVSKASFTVLKAGLKILFLGDMLKSYSSLISNQLSQNQAQLNQFVSRFMNLQVSLNVSDNSNQGNNITPGQALDNLSQISLNQNSTSNVSNQQDTFLGSNGKTYILTVVQYGEGQLIGKATESVTGLLAIETAPSYTEPPEELMNELKSILGA